MITTSQLGGSLPVDSRNCFGSIPESLWEAVQK